MRVIYVTTPSKEVAIELGGKLVEARLAACVNILPAMTSIYEWQGTLHRDDEAVLIVKTSQSRIEEVMREIKSSHPYDCPAIFSWSPETVEPTFLQWIETQSAVPQSKP